MPALSGWHLYGVGCIIFELVLQEQQAQAQQAQQELLFLVLLALVHSRQFYQ